MLVEVNKQEFLKRMRIVEKAIQENKIKPIISCIYVETRKDELFFCGTNLETTISTTMKCESVKQEGKLAFQYQLVDEYVKEIKDEFIKIRVEENVLHIDSEDSTSEFVIMNADHYPNIFEQNDFSKTKENFSIDSLELFSIFEKIKFSASNNDNISINCVRVEANENVINFITTDTYRLTYLKKEIDKIEENFNISIPLETIEAVNKILRNLEGQEVKVYFINNHIYFIVDNVLIVSRIIDLAFPNYKSILDNSSHDKKLVINVEEFTNIIRKVIIFVKNNNESRYGGTFKFSKDKMEIIGISDIAKINEKVKVNYSGEEVKISLNIKFLLDFIQNISKEKDVEVEFLHSNTSVKITESNNKNYVYMLMPLALKDV